MDRISASAYIAAPPAVVFSFLADPRNHWLLARGKIELRKIDAGEQGRMRGWVVIRGPLGLRRRARTRVFRSLAPSSLSGVAELGRRTRASVSWTLEETEDAATHVVLSAAITRVGALDRLLLLVGARWWMRRLFAEVLDALRQAPLPHVKWVAAATAGAATSTFPTHLCARPAGFVAPPPPAPAAGPR